MRSNDLKGERKNEKPKLLLGRPEDRSFEAFKRWVTDVFKALTGVAPEDLTEAEGKAAWKDFWH